MTILENDQLKVTISERGAELTSIVYKKYHLEYLWQASPLFWAKHSPVLFPIVGTLKENEYLFQRNRYSIGRHGFARERLFELSSHTPESAEFHIKADSTTLQQYPFDFELNIRYSILISTLSTDYIVYNPSDRPLYFSIGAHPAFNVPIEPGLSYDDYYLHFNKPETAPRWPITSGGLIGNSPQPFFNNSTDLQLSHGLFAGDALVFKGLNSNTITLRSDKSPRGLHFLFNDFPYLGLWAAPNADFVCIEPWCGIADSENASQRLEEKEGIIRLEPREYFRRSWSVELF